MVNEMSRSIPFTPSNVITATMDILNSYPEDAYAKNAKRSLGRLRQRLGYSSPETFLTNFWCSSLHYEGYYDICQTFDSSDSRSKAVFDMYSSVLKKFQARGFDGGR